MTSRSCPTCRGITTTPRLIEHDGQGAFPCPDRWHTAVTALLDDQDREMPGPDADHDLVSEQERLRGLLTRAVHAAADAQRAQSGPGAAVAVSADQLPGIIRDQATEIARLRALLAVLLTEALTEWPCPDPDDLNGCYCPGDVHVDVARIRREAGLT